MKNKILSILFVATIFLIMILGILIPDKEVSISERRRLTRFPKIEIATIMNGNFFEDMNNYLVEQFPLRDYFRKIKGIVSKHVFQKKEENGIFIKDDAIYQLNSLLDEKSINHFINLLNKIQTNYIKTEHVYYAIIPDKMYYLNDGSIPKLDYDKLRLLLNNGLTNMNYIDLFDTLDLDSYYRTDIHWKQEELEKVVAKMQMQMNLESAIIPTEEKIYSSFYGALYGRVANNLKQDILTYLTNFEIENTTVWDYEKQNLRKVYEEADLYHIDSYDIFLGGAKPFLVLENSNQKNGKELVLFRDSFGSSIAPLLVSNYSKITLIDLRYFSSNMLDKIEEIEFKKENQDILFLYSVPIINSSFTLK